MNATVSDEIISEQDEARWNLLYKKAQGARALRAFELFRAKGIEPILIKGLAAGRFYPEAKARPATDMDLAVSAADYDAGTAIAVSAAPEGLAIDLHRELRHFDTVGWDDLFANSRLLPVDGGEVRVLRPEDHLRVLCVHWLTNRGEDRERLWDIYYAVANRPADFDWDRFLNVVSPHRRRWMVCTIGLAHRFLGLELEDTPIGDEARDLPAWLVEAVTREWASEVKLEPLELVIRDRRKLLQQLRKRLRPNPIWATVQMEGSFDARTRVFYQVGNFVRRMIPSYRRVSATIRSREE